MKRRTRLQSRTALARTPLARGNKPLRRRKTFWTAGPDITVPAGLTRVKKSGPKTSGEHKPRRRTRDTGFSPAVRLLIYTRAGNGDPQKAACEACGIHLGADGGQIQHIYARGQGGSRHPLYRSAANGALLCGTPFSGDHGLCESRDRHMEAMGFWRRRNGAEQPGDYPVMLHGVNGGGTVVWLTPEGDYSQHPRPCHQCENGANEHECAVQVCFIEMVPA